MVLLRLLLASALCAAARAQGNNTGALSLPNPRDCANR